MARASQLLFNYQLALLALLALLSASHAHPVNKADQELPSQRIVGGQLTDIAVHPHQISLRRKSLYDANSTFSHLCGGSIIDEDKVITAAHCIIATVPSQYKVVAGTNLRRGTDGVIVSVKEIIMHEKYNASTYENDIALLILSPPLPLNNFTIKAIQLAERQPLENATSTVTGWGTIKAGGASSDNLLAVDVPIVGNDVCNDDYANDSIKPSMLCAGVRGVGGKDACQGDSGGPLIVHNQLAGVVSWGRGCAQPKYPGVYANVAYLLDWIKSKVTLPAM